MPYKYTSVTTCALVDLGHARPHQEDSLAYVELPIGANTNALDRGHLFVLADGVGGLEAGEIASSLAVETILKNYYSLPATTLEKCLKNTLVRANQEIWREKEEQKTSIMATTVVCAVIDGARVLISHLGDSRAYLLHSDELKQLTEDHSEGGHTITRSLGAERHYSPELSTFPIERGDRLLLCSDGLHGMVDDETIKRLLLTYTNLQSACDALVEQALLAGGKDNISLLITQIDGIENENIPASQWHEIIKFSHQRLATTSHLEKQEDKNWPESSPNKASPEASPGSERGKRWLLSALIILLITMLVLLIAWYDGVGILIDQNNMPPMTPTEPFIPITPSPTP